VSDVGIPRKGRNAGVALEQELDVGAKFIVNLLNGMGKEAAKTGENFDEVSSYASSIDFIEMQDTGRDYPRPVFNEFSLDGTRLIGGGNDFGDADIVYRGLDSITEDYLDQKLIREEKSLIEYTEEVADCNGYELEELYGDEEARWVKWGLMNNSLQPSASKVLYPCEFENLSEAALDRIDVDAEMETFSEYAESNGYAGLDQEEIVYEASEEVAGMYMWVSGNTADEIGLDKEQVPGFRSKLGKFQRCKD
jgi:hypothetical protein